MIGTTANYKVNQLAANMYEPNDPYDEELT